MVISTQLRKTKQASQLGLTTIPHLPFLLPARVAVPTLNPHHALNLSKSTTSIPFVLRRCRLRLCLGGTSARPSRNFLPRDVAVWTCSTSPRRRSELLGVLRRRPRRLRYANGGVYTTSSQVEDAAPLHRNATHQVGRNFFLACYCR